jgi:GH24 family phage-related lysozyme (muramidase)
MSFIFGGDTGITWEQAQAKRKLAEELARANMSTPRNVGEGLNALGRALAYRGITKRAGEAENRLRGDANAAFDSIFGMGGYTPTTSTSGPGAEAAVPSVVRPEAADAYREMNPTTTGDATLGLIRQFEGFRETPYWDVNAYRTGYGSDTITTADGRVVPVTQGARVTREDAERDLLRRVNSEFMPSARSAVGPEAFDALDPNQQAALVSLAYNYGANAWGDDLAGVAAAARSGDPAATAQAIRALGSHNGGINANRRAREAAFFAGTGQPAPAGPPPTMSAQGRPPASMELAMRLAQLAGNPALDPGRRALVNALLGQTMQAMQPQSEADRLDLELKRLQLEQARNPQTERNRIVSGEEAAAMGLDPSKSYNVTEGPNGVEATAIGGGGINVNTGNPQNFANDYFEERYATINDQAANAATMMGMYEIADAALNGGLETGPLAETTLTLRRLGQSLGMDIDENATADAEMLKSITNRMALMMRNPDSGMGMPGAVSDRDLTFLKDAQIGLDRSPEGNRRMLKAFMALEQRKIDLAQFTDEYLAANGRLDYRYNQAVREWAKANPLFGEGFFDGIEETTLPPVQGPVLGREELDALQLLEGGQ